MPLRPGSDIAFLGGIINHILSNDADFREYVVAFTNASHIIDEAYGSRRISMVSSAV